MPKIELYALVTRAQEYISRNYATVLADKNRRQELENCIGKYLYDTAYTVEGYGLTLGNCSLICWCSSER